MIQEDDTITLTVEMKYKGQEWKMGSQIIASEEYLNAIGGIIPTSDMIDADGARLTKFMSNIWRCAKNEPR